MPKISEIVHYKFSKRESWLFASLATFVSFFMVGSAEGSPLFPVVLFLAAYLWLLTTLQLLLSKFQVSSWVLWGASFVFSSILVFMRLLSLGNWAG